MPAILRPPTRDALAPEVARSATPSTPPLRFSRDLLPYFAAGIVFGVILVKSEALSWYRIQEMFRFQAFHMYALLGSAFFTALISTQILKRLGARARTGEPIALAPKQLGRGYRYAFGGAIFGVGWALSGACPGPVFALIGSGTTVYIVTLLSAIAGTWTYGYLRPRLPH